MASNTSRLDLLKKNPVTDGEDTFNIETMLNENWEKIDKRVALIDPATGKLLPGQVDIDTSDLANKQEMQTELGKKVDKLAGKVLSTNDYTTPEKTKLAGIATNANNYSHPANHPASIITQDANNRFMKDAERTKLSGIETGAQVNEVSRADLQVETQARTTHMADEVAHGIGNKATLVTSHKSSIVGAINEAFTFANNGKTLIANATSAKGVPASPSDTFPVLAGKIGQIIPGAAIKSVQRGRATMKGYSQSTLQIPVSAVDVTKSYVKVSYKSSQVDGPYSAVLANLSNSTTISLSLGTQDAINDVNVYWELIEFESGVEVQRGVSTMLTNGVLYSAINITLVDMDKSFIEYSFDMTDYGGGFKQFPMSDFDGLNVISFSRRSGNGSVKVAWQVIEFL